MSGASGGLAIGLMEGAYFVGRKEIVDFINSTLELRINKVEETASGAVACQLLDIMYPNVVPMNKVDWNAKKDFEFLANYKILQTCFTKLHIDRHIDVDRLITAKYMDNLEFMQWFKRYFELQVADKGDYDCRSRRALGKGGASVPAGSAGGGVSSPPTVSSSAKTGGVAGSAATKPATLRAPKTVSPAAVPKATALKPASAPAKKTSSLSTLPPHSSSSGAPGAAEAATRQIAALTKQVDDAVRSGNELRTEMEGLEKERDFYFEKLREIEIMLQELEDNGNGNDLTASIFKILYKTQDGFEQAADTNDIAENSPINLVAEDLEAEGPVLEGY
jgi:RP/EB family microtubule-associated protein